MFKTTMMLASGLALTATGVSAEDLEVTYTVAVAAVPTMAEWAMISMGVAMATLALVALSRKRTGRGIAFGMAALLSVAALGVSPPARAADGTLSLDGGSPDQVPLFGNSGTITVTNNAANTITITSVQIINGNNVFVSDSTCQAGVRVKEKVSPEGEDSSPIAISRPESFSLAVGASCTVTFQPD